MATCADAKAAEGGVDVGKPLVLSVEDESFMGELLRELLAHEYEVVSALTVAEALEVTRRRTPDLILLDLQLPDLDGEDFVNAYRAAGGRAPIIVVSGRYDAKDAARRIGARLLAKPFELGMLEVLVGQQLGMPAAY